MPFIPYFSASNPLYAAARLQLNAHKTILLCATFFLSATLWGQAIPIPSGTPIPLTTPRFISIDVPGSTITNGYALNDSAVVVGAAQLPDQTYVAFTWNAGDITSFQPLDAGTNPGQGTLALGINASGTVTGFYSDANGVKHGFVRTSAGEISSFDVPDAGSQTGAGTIAIAINSSGEIVGTYTDASGVIHSFLRNPAGAIVTFDVAGANSTFTQALNDSGVITGYFVDANLLDHGFVRGSDGTITTFDVGVAGTSPYSGTVPEAVNAAGTITGSYSLPNPNYQAGFVRTADGVITTFQGKSETSVLPSGINTNGVVTGFYVAASSGGFLRSATGTLYPFHGPNKEADGAIPYAINNSNAVTGYYFNSSGKQIGFLLIPQAQ